MKNLATRFTRLGFRLALVSFLSASIVWVAPDVPLFQMPALSVQPPAKAPGKAPAPRKSAVRPTKPTRPASAAISATIPIIPAVPASVLTQARLKPTAALPTRSRLSILPGVNEVLPIARGQLNRLITPFAHPEVVTTSSAHTEIRGQVVYVATDSQAPVTLFVTEKGVPAPAMSLSLIPRSIPPREIVLRFADSVQPAASANPRAAHWEESQPYLSALKTLFRKLALGEVPPGYGLQEMTDEQTDTPCRQRGLAFDFRGGQRLTGRHLEVWVGTIQNTTRRTLTFQETACRAPGVAAVAAWPNRTLKPGQLTEVYVVKRLREAPSHAVARPFLLGVRS